MRGLAALSVVGGHAVSARPDMVGAGVAEGALTILASGVDIFFVISGFIIASTAVSRPHALEFVFRRAVRIYPVYWLVLLAAFVSGHWIALAPEDRPALDLGLLFAWTYPNWYIAPAWSIAFEMHFYVAVAVILALAPDRLFKLLFAALAVVAIAVLFRMPLGIFAHPLIPAFAAILFATGWYWIFVRGAVDAHLARLPTYGLGGACLVYAVVAAELNGARFPKILQWLGDISYSLYVIHYLLMKWAASFTELWRISPSGVILASIALSIGLAAFLHALVEMPTLNWGRKFRLRRPASTAPQAVPSQAQGAEATG